MGTNETKLTAQYYYTEMAKLWVGIFLAVGATIGLFAGFAYLVDTSNKNVPVIMKYAMSSVVHGVPDQDEMDQWRIDFHKKEVRVWPYYSVLGILCMSVATLIVFNLFGIDDREYNRIRGTHPRRATYHTSGCCQNCYCRDVYCDCYCCGNCDCPHHSGGCNGNDCKGDAMPVIVVLLIIVAAIIVISAVWVIVLWGLKKMVNNHDAYASRLFAYSQERSGETRVLGRDEADVPSCSKFVV
jgi:hypothetical protein